MLKSGVRVNWGNSTDSPLKADIVMALLEAQADRVDRRVQPAQSRRSLTLGRLKV